MTHSCFERLPPELLIPILTNLSGLECLYNILQASPAAYRVFGAYSVEIFEPVLSSGDLMKFTVSLIRIAAYLRQFSLPPYVYDLCSLRNCLADETTTYRWDPPLWEHPPCPLPAGITATALRGILASHRKIMSLTVGCLDYYLGLFRALKPEHLVDKKFYYDHKQGDGGKHDYVGAWELDPPREPFPMCDAGPPTWVEEQRVLRAWSSLRARGLSSRPGAYPGRQTSTSTSLPYAKWAPTRSRYTALPWGHRGGRTIAGFPRDTTRARSICT